MIKMLIESSSKGSSYQAKQESSDINNTNKAAPSTITSSSSRSQWSAFRNPRIVRVSRTFGGKDRHSKVCTIRGLRDRRIRLSVPTAIQLYDLQEKLGLSQPSKVIDWLIEATKHDIDKLPPLHFPQGFFPPHQFHHHHPHHHMLSMMSGGGGGAVAGGGFYDGGSYQSLLAKGKWIKTTATNNQHENSSCYDDQDHGSIGDSSAQKLFPTGTNSSNNSSSLSGLLNNAMAYNSYNSDQPSSLSLSQFGGSHGLLFPSQLLDPHHPGSGSGVQFSSSNLPLATPSPPVFSPYYAPPFIANLSMESGGDPRQINNHVQFLSSSSSQVMPLLPSSMMNSPLRRVPMPFSSKLLDSDHNHNRSSQADDKE